MEVLIANANEHVDVYAGRQARIYNGGIGWIHKGGDAIVYEGGYAWVHEGGEAEVYEGGKVWVHEGGYALVHEGGHADGPGRIVWEKEPDDESN